MVDPRLLHQITVEMCTGFLLLAGLAVAAKAAADLGRRGLRGRFPRLDRWASIVEGFAEPAAVVALLAGVLGAFLSMYTGSRAWPEPELLASPTLHNKLLFVGLSQTMFLSALVLRLRFRSRIWDIPTTGALYALLVLSGDGFMVLQNSAGGHLAGTGSVLDDVLGSAGISLETMWVMPPWAALATLVAFPLATALVARRLRASDQETARLRLRRLARDVRDLLGHAREAKIPIEGIRRRIVRANADARRRDAVRAVQRMAQAKRELMKALSFTEAPDGSWIWEGVAPPVPEASVDTRAAPVELEARRIEAAASSRPKSPPAGERTRPVPSSGTLTSAVEFVERSWEVLGEDMTQVVERELRWARDVLLDLKVLGRDLTGPIGLLKEARLHVRNEEWDDALRCLKDFRREVGTGDA